MRSVVAKICGVVVAVILGFFMYASVLYNSLPLDSGERRAWVSVLETVLLAPTIWVTRPIHQALYLSGHYGLIPWLTFAEIGLLAVFYGLLVHQAIMGKLAPRRVAGWLFRRRWAVGGVLGVMIVASVAGRVATAKQDFRKEVDLPRGTAEVAAMDTASDVQMTVLETAAVPFPDGTEAAAIMRCDGGSVWALVLGQVLSDPSDFMSSTADLTLLQLERGQWSERRNWAGIQLSSFGTKFRPPSDPASAAVLFFETIPAGPQLMLPFSEIDRIYPFPPYMDSAEGFAVGDSIWVVGFGFDWRDWDDPSVPRIAAYENPNFATYSIGVFRVDPNTSEVSLAGACDHFTDHEIKTLDATVDDDGVLHLLAAEVLIANENSLRMHHLSFDTGASRWLGDDVVWSSEIFTSSVSPLVRRSSQGVEMLWNLSRSPDVETGGVFACSSSDPRIFRLTEREDGFLAALADPQPGVELVVGRVDPGFQSERTPGLSQQEQLMKSLEAMNAARDAMESNVDWYLKRGGEWFLAGTTTVPARLYEVSDGQTGFWLWPDDEGRLVAAFQTETGMIVQTMALAASSEDASTE